MEPAHSFLKRSTADLHAEVEAAPCLSTLLSPDVARGDVHRALQVFRRHHATWEPVLHASLAPHLPDAFLRPRWRLADLEADLIANDVALERPSAAPRSLPYAEALGWLYVHEGARHGAIVIRKALARALGDDFVEPLRFFSGSGDQVRRMWTESCALFDTHLAAPADRGAAMQGARDAFRAVEEAARGQLASAIFTPSLAR